MDCFWGDVGDICYKLFQVPAGLLQVGGVNDDLHQLCEITGVRLGNKILDPDDVCLISTALFLPRSVLCGVS